MDMRLCAIYNCWDDWDLLNHSIENIGPLVDGVIIVWSRMSNYGEAGESTEAKITTKHKSITTYQCEPDLRLSAQANETMKRNRALRDAYITGYTHFVTMDCDEFYNPVDFLREKARFETEPDLVGLVSPVQCFFKSPTLTIGLDVTLVPFIHKLTATIAHTFNKKYPFAWSKDQIRIDPTRSLNIHAGVKMSTATMFHMSWVRSDVRKKIRNSTAKANIERSTTLIDDYKNAAPGYYCRFYERTLHEVPNYFSIPEMVDHSL